jgi:hypothetical protein
MTSQSDPLGFELLAFFTADHAAVADGKLYLDGGCWNRLQFPAYPQVVPAMALVAVLKVPFGRYNASHKFRFGMEDPDRKSMPFYAEGAFRVGAQADMEYGDPTVMPIAMPIHNLVIAAPGDYSFTFEVDEVELGRYGIRAIQIAVPMQFTIQPPESEAS